MNKEVENLFLQQKEDWELVNKNFDALTRVKTKEVEVRGIKYKVQFNPERILSSSAKVDKQSIQERRCFLCSDNRPKEQKGIDYKGYYILINPFPIFPIHLTIIDKNHILQECRGRINDMLDLAKELDNYTLFYNGAKCGASAPDHMHFQAGNKGFLGLEQDIACVQSRLILEKGKAKLFLKDDEPRNRLVIEGSEAKDIEELFDRVYEALPMNEDDHEPMMNLLCWYDNGKWTLVVLLRKKHRPNCYFAEGKDKILISPASVDLGGVFITPLEEDFNKITSKDIEQIITEVSMSKTEIEDIINKITQ